VASEEAEGGEGGDSPVERLLQAACGGVPPRLLELLSLLLADKVVEVRTSAVHAVKRLSRLQPPLFRANGGAAVSALIKNLAPLTLDKRNTHVQTAAQRSMMHCLSAAGWTNPEGLPRQQLGGECTNTCADFLRRSYKRMLAMESDAEGSDEDPI